MIFTVFVKINAQEFKSRDAVAQEIWVDSVFSRLTEKQKIAQLFMVAAYSNLNETHYGQLEKLIKKNNIGGLIFMQGGPGRQVTLINRYQAAAKTPLLIGMDLENGLAMRLDSTIGFAKQMTLGAIQENQYIYNLGAEIARQCKHIGVHINFAPVLDINNNINNPVIGMRSFGEDKKLVTEKGLAFMQGMQEYGIIAVGKHFPGHGDTESDSHFSLPVIKHSKARLRNIELYPFRKLINEDLMGVMSAHLQVPVYDSTTNMPSSLSPKIVTQVLKRNLKFKGLIFTDALNMKAVTRYFNKGEINLKAIKAGNDVLLFSENVPESIDLIAKAMTNGEIPKKALYKSVKKILKAKYWAGLSHFKPTNPHYVLDRLNTPNAKLLDQKMYEHAITLVKNEGESIPIKVLDNRTFATLNIGSSLGDDFQTTLRKYVNFKEFYIPKGSEENKYERLFMELKNFNTVVVGIHGLNNKASEKFGTNEAYLAFLKKLQRETNVIIVVFGNPYALKYFEGMDNLICTYESNKYTKKLAPQIIFGAIPAKGKLPISASPMLKIGKGIETQAIGRLAYSLPEDVGLRSEVLKRIDLIAKEAIRLKATPGCQILVARNGTVVYEKSFGNFTYDKRKRVTNETVYDLASLTKVLATLQAVMFLEDQGFLDVEQKASFYLPDLKGTNKEDLIIKNILTHQSGLLSFIPFWVKTVSDDKLSPDLYRTSRGYPYNIEISPKIYGKQILPDSIWTWIKDSSLRKRKKKDNTYGYRYSDLGFYIMKRISEKLLNRPINEFLDENFYAPLGTNYLGYLPLERMSKSKITPTERDVYYRNSLVHGIVHDPGAAMMGGVSGHAGLFGNANDVAKLLQMNAQEGMYAGTQYFQNGTVFRFALKQFEDNRRGLGWDKPAPKGQRTPVSTYASPATYGHTGFTGTAVWVDPAYKLTYIFLSNRIYPTANNRILIKKNIRTRIQDIIYQAVEK